MEGSTLIKIGQAKSLKRRLAAMQMGLPFKLELLYMLEVEEPKTRTHAGESSEGLTARNTETWKHRHHGHDPSLCQRC